MKRKDARYRQCALQKGNSHHMAWIPEQFAVEGKFIRIKDDDGWRVNSVGSDVKTAVEADDLSQLHKKTRRASDI